MQYEVELVELYFGFYSQTKMNSAKQYKAVTVS